MRIGVDLGGSKIEIIVLGDGGDVLLRERVATPQGDYAATLAAVAGLVAAAEKRVMSLRGSARDGIHADGAGSLCVPGIPLRGQVTAIRVGIGIPGAESRVTGLIKNANSTCLIGKPLKRDLEAALGREVRLANDANCFALSEAVDGAGAGASVVFGVILGTGVGGGIVVDGKVLSGANAIAGEWGHNPLAGEWIDDLPPGPAPRLALHSQPAAAAQSMLCETLPRPAEGADGGSPLRGSVAAGGAALGRPGSGAPTCYCGRKGCIELYLSGPGLARDHRRTSGDLGGEVLPAEAIVARAAVGDADCEATLQRYEARLAKALAGVINLLDPDVIVLGGGLSNIDRLYQNVPRLWGEHVFSDQVATRLLKHRHGDSSGVRGAAWLWN